MIKNIIFDMGGVLVDYDPEKVCYSLFDRETADILLKELFRNPIWSELDRGITTPEEVIERVKNKIPAHALEKATEMTFNYYPYLPPLDYMYPVVEQLKKNGYGLYLLSNASDNFYNEKDGIPAMRLLDGYLISADYKLLKPEKEIYEALYEKFSLRPEECFFIDDMPVNIEGALKTGMTGHCFSDRDPERLKTALRNSGVNI